MHWSASIAQLLATVIMVLVRLWLYRRISTVPKITTIPRGQELDVMAKTINECQDWKVSSPGTATMHGKKVSPPYIADLATCVLETRIRLTQLSGWSSESTEVAEQVSNAMEAALNYLCKAGGELWVKGNVEQMETFDCILDVNVTQFHVEFSNELAIPLQRSRSEDKWTPWKVHREKVKAVLSLWVSHFSQESLQSDNLWLLGPDDTLTQIMYDWWIDRGTKKTHVDEVNTFCSQHFIHPTRVIDLYGSQTKAEIKGSEKVGLLGTTTYDSLPSLCGQFILGSFVTNIIKCVDKLRGKSYVTRGTNSDQFLLLNDSVRGMAETLQQGGFISIEDSMRLVVPALHEADILPDPLDIVEEIISMVTPATGISALEIIISRLLYLCQARARRLGSEERWAAAGATFLRLVETFSNAHGSQAESTSRARKSMDQFAIEFVQSKISASVDAQYQVAKFDEPFRLHAASARGLINEVLRGIHDRIGIDTWDDEHETPISLAVKNNYLDISRLLIFYGAPVDRDLLSIAADPKNNISKPISNEMIRILLLNLKNQTEILLDECTKDNGIVDLLLDVGIDTTVKDPKGYTPLHIATLNGCERVVQILLSNGADITARGPKGQTVLHLAAQAGNGRVIKQLLHGGAGVEARNEEGETAMHIAGARGFLDIIMSLYEAGADLNAPQKDGRTVLHVSAMNNQVEIVRWLMELKGKVNLGARDNDHAVALHLAARKRYDVVTSILAQAGPIMTRAKDKYGQTPLIVASREDGREAVLGTLLSHGSVMTERDVSGRSSLEYAASSGHEEAVRLFVKAGTLLTNRDGFGRTALHYASMGKYPSIVRLLLESGSSIDAADKDGWTALHYAYCSGSHLVVDVLEEKGADCSRLDRHGRTAKSYNHGKLEINFWSRPLPGPYPKADS